ncbi:MAG: hypothetical protein ABH875_03895 [Candidatus Omnitrophota bacterium]
MKNVLMFAVALLVITAMPVHAQESDMDTQNVPLGETPATMDTQGTSLGMQNAPITEIGLESQERARKLCEECMIKIYAGNIQGAFDLIQPIFPVPESEFLSLRMQTMQQLGMVGQRFGKAVGYEFIKSQEVKDTFLKYIYIEKFENHAIRWVFTFYKPKDHWLLNNFGWDDTIEALFY